MRMKCVIKAAVITGENPRFSPISATGYNLSVLRRRLVGSVSQTQEEICSEEHASSIFRQSSNSVSGFSMMVQVRLCVVGPLFGTYRVG